MKVIGLIVLGVIIGGFFGTLLGNALMTGIIQTFYRDATSIEEIPDTFRALRSVITFAGVIAGIVVAWKLRPGQLP